MLNRITPLALLLALCAPVFAQKIINDRQIRISSAADINTKRADLIEYVWGGEGLPTQKLPRLPVSVNDESPIPGLTDLQRVDTLVVDMEAGLKSYAHHFIPRVKNGRLVILHAGHFASFSDSTIPADVGHGMRRTLEGLLGDGYSVLAVYMPRNVVFDTAIDVSDDGGYEAHNAIYLDAKYRPKRGSPMKYFLEPLTAYVNYLTTRSISDNFPEYKDLSIVGLSGGGWAATVYPAIDTRIKLSISVAGSLPLYLRSGPSIGDAEQTDPTFYSIAGYPELYVMGSDGPGRKQVQVYNRNDWCCFSETYHDPALAGGLFFDDAVREFESNVRESLISLGNGDLFSVEIDEAAYDHQITWDAIYDTILPELNASRRYVATADRGEAIVRGVRGYPAVFINDIWSPAKLPAMAGTAALLRGSVNLYDMFYRTARNQLVHVWRPPMIWSRPNVLLNKIISDPAAASRLPGSFDVVVLGNDYLLYHINRTGGATTTQVVSENVKGLGQPVLLASGPDRLEVFYRSWNRRVYHGIKIGSEPWLIEDLGGQMMDFPTAVREADGTLRVYVRGMDGFLWESRRAPGDKAKWTSWASISAETGSGEIKGSPSAALIDGKVNVYARSTDSTIRKFVLETTWTSRDESSSGVGSPTASSAGAFTRSTAGSLSYSDGGAWSELGGVLD